MSELVFIVEEAQEGGYSARALGASVFSEGATLEELYENVRDAVRCHFDDTERPKVMGLGRDELITKLFGT